MGSFRINNWLTDKVTISRKIQTQDNFGGLEDSFKDILFDIQARLWPVGGLRTRNVGGETFLPSMRMIVSPDHRINIGDRVKKEDEIFLVIQLFQRKDMRKVQHQEMLLAKVDL